MPIAVESTVETMEAMAATKVKTVRGREPRLADQRESDNGKSQGLRNILISVCDANCTVCLRKRYDRAEKECESYHTGALPARGAIWSAPIWRGRPWSSARPYPRPPRPA